MTDNAPRTEVFPEIFPIFPLAGALLLPGGRLPLNIFEPRYLAMVDEALGAGRIFGMIQPDSRAGEGPAGPGLYRIGCLGRISAFSETDDGRYLITLTGLIRFDLVEEAEMCRGYRRVHGDVSRFRHDPIDAAAGEGADGRAPTRVRLMTSLRRYFDAVGVEADWDAIAAIPDRALIVSLCMACPFSPVEKQALLEAPTGDDRASALVALLEINAHRHHE